MTLAASSIPSITGSAPGRFGWLVRLRWVALAGQSLTVFVTANWLEVPLDLTRLIACLAFTGLTNLLLLRLPAWFDPESDRACAGLLAVDTLTLSVMLGAAGGAHNPFTSFYLLSVALAALLLPQRLTVVVMVLAGMCFTMLYLGAPVLCGDIAHTGNISQELHFEGMLVALGLTSISIAYFVGLLHSELRKAEQILHENQLRFARQERFVGLATLAAGVAHELATPLATIAVISREFELAACGDCASSTCRDDARLIRTEVERCRSIIERLNADSTSGVGDASEPIALENLAVDLMPFLLPEHAARLRVAIETPRGSEWRVPKVALLQALAVLIKNGCEADPSDRSVILEASATPMGLQLKVTDRGAGLPPEIKSRLGEPFLTTKPAGRGMGLGLFIVRMFAERLQGRLEFDATSGEGTTAILSIPSKAIP